MNHTKPSCWMGQASQESPVAIFYHCLFGLGEPWAALPGADHIVFEQMEQIRASGLLAATSEFHVGVNGGEESEGFARAMMPEWAQITCHGRASRSENPTIVLLEEWVKVHPGWQVLYLHTKGATHPVTSVLGRLGAAWRRGMMTDLVLNWRQCVADLNAGYDVVTSTWLWGMADGTQNIPAGNFLWVTSDFARQLPSIHLRDRIRQDGIGALTSRYEAEVYWGYGPPPRVKSYQPGWTPWCQ